MSRSQAYRRAFTLVELLVVVSIVGLLAVAVLPALSNGGDRRLLRGAAERVDTHFKRAAADATGKVRGAAVWIEPDVGGTAVLDLNYARVPERPSNPTASPPEVPVLITSLGNTATVSPPLIESVGSIKFPQVPSEFRIINSNTIGFLPGQTPYNAVFPASANNYVAYPPPAGPRITSRPTVLQAGACVDLASSTIGVFGFGASATPFQEDINRNGTLDGGEDADSDGILDTYSQVTLLFDVQGRLSEIWAASTDGITVPAQKNFQLTAAQPVAFLVTSPNQSGNPKVGYPTSEASPGAGWQNPDAVWVVIDPKTGRNLLVPNKFQPTDLADAQSFIVDDLAP